MHSRPTRRSTLVAALIAIVALLATGCGSSSGNDKKSTSSEPVTLQVNLFGTFGYKEAGLFEEYQRLHPNIKIAYNTVEFEQNYYQALQTHLAAGSGLGDIQGIEVGRIAEQVQAQGDKWVNFNDYGGDQLKANFFPWKWQQATTSGGQTIGLGDAADLDPLDVPEPAAGS